MKAIKTIDEKGAIALEEVDVPEVEHGQCLVRIYFAALNRRDYWITKSLYPGIVKGATLGSDGCGEVVKGSDRWLGKQVVINPNNQWGEDPRVQSFAYNILGMPSDGTLAEYVVVPEDRLVEKPAYLTSEEAASIPLAGLTAYRACMVKGAVAAGQKVLITGIGGGVAQFALSMAVAENAEVFVTSGSLDKIGKAQSLGASGGFNYRDTDWVKQAKKETGGFDVIVDGSGGPAINAYMKLLNPAGKLVVYGATAGKVPDFDLFKLFWSQVEFMGSTMGNDQEFAEMIGFCEANQIQPALDGTFSLKDFPEAFRRFEDQSHFGKIIVDLQ